MGKKFTKGYGAARTRGMGLQDEKLKPGKVTKAFAGVLAAGLGAKKAMKEKKMAPVGMGGIGAAMVKEKAIRKILGRDKGSPKSGEKYRKYLKGLKEVTDKSKQKNAAKNFFKTVGVFPGVPTLQSKAPSIPKKDLKNFFKNVGKFPAVSPIVGKEARKKLSTKTFIKRRLNLSSLGSRAVESAKASKYGRIAAGVAAAALAAKAGLEKMYEKRTGKKPFTKRPQKKMGGGMMMRPNPVGYKTGSSIKVKCKLGKNKPTKLY